MRNCSIILLVFLLLAGCNQTSTQSSAPAASEAASIEDAPTASDSEPVWPDEAERAVEGILYISQSIVPTDPPDIQRTVRYSGEETIVGTDCYVFIVYADLPERFENLGTFAKSKTEEVYYYFDLIADRYRRIIVGNQGIFLEDEDDADSSLDVPYAIGMARQEYVGDNIIEVPKFVGEGDVLEQLNAEIMDFAADAIEVSESGDETFWAELKSYPFRGGRYLQVIVTKAFYPSYGSDGEVRSFVYDVENDAPVTAEQALADSGLSVNTMIQTFEQSSFVNEQSGLVHLRVDGVRFRPDDMPEFLVVAELSHPGAENWESIYRFVPGEGFLKYDADKLYPAGEPDALIPLLYYDQAENG